MRASSDLGLRKTSNQLAGEARCLYSARIRPYVRSSSLFVLSSTVLINCSTAGAALARTLSYQFGSKNPTCK